MENKLFSRLMEAKYHLDLAKFVDIVFQLLLYKYLAEDMLIRFSLCNLSDIYMQINVKQDVKDIVEEAFMNAEIYFQEETKSDYLDHLFDIDIIDAGNSNVFESVLEVLSTIPIKDIDTNILLQNFLNAMGKSKGYGDNNPPISLCKLVAELICINNIKYESIADQCCGVAMLSSIIGKKCEVSKFFLQDNSTLNVRLAKINMLLSGIDINSLNIVREDILYHDEFIEEKFDLQVSMPPFSLLCDFEMLKEDVRFADYSLGHPHSNADSLFLENMLYHMPDSNSIIAYICNMNMLSKHDLGFDIRKDLAEKNLIDAVIKIPSNVLFGTMIESYIVILKSNKSKKNTLFIDASDFFSGVPKKEISDDSINSICEIYKNRQEIEKICFVASISDIRENQYCLGIEKYITKKSVERLLKKETLVPLSSLIDVLKPSVIEGYGKVLKRKACSYPIDYSKLEEGSKTSVKIEKGDIIFSNMLFDSMYLVDECTTEEIYVSTRDIVIRPTKIQSEYLYNFLKSDIGRIIVGIECPTVVGALRIRKDAFCSISIPLPKKSSEYYRKVFEIENHLRIDISAFNSLISNRDKYIDEGVEEILNREIASKVKRYKEDAMKEFLADDIKELNTCYRSKAYKATLILAGSILEAVLIDWLSEIDGKDYFSEDYRIIDKRTGREKKADLIDYIDAIEEIERPRWVEEAKKAHIIRKKRNLVHAKLGIASNEINDKTCVMVINYLKAVLKTRGIS